MRAMDRTRYRSPTRLRGLTATDSHRADLENVAAPALDATRLATAQPRLPRKAGALVVRGEMPVAE